MRRMGEFVAALSIVLIVLILVCGANAVDVIIALANAAMGVAALALLVALAWVLAIVVGTLDLIARDRAEDFICTYRMNRRHRRGEF